MVRDRWDRSLVRSFALHAAAAAATLVVLVTALCGRMA